MVFRGQSSGVSRSLQVVTALMDESLAVLAGPKARHQADRQAVRHSSEAVSVVVGGRRVPVRRRRARAVDGSTEPGRRHVCGKPSGGVASPIRH